MRLNDIPPWPIYSQAAAEAVRHLVARGETFDYSGTSRPVRDLEEGFSALHGGMFALSFNSGTSALFAAFAGLGIGPGDEVIVPNFTFLASMTPLLWLGAVPVLVDSDPAEPSISVRAVEEAVTARTRAVVVTHLFGNPVDIRPLSDLSRRLGLRLIEDCSHAHASMVGSDHVGTFGDAAIYSIGAGKVVSGGHGGILVTSQVDVRDIALLTGHFKPRARTDLLTEDLRRFAEIALGGNLRISPLSATLALDHLHSLHDLSRCRRANAEILDEGLQNVLTPVRTTGERQNQTFYDLVYSLPTGWSAIHRDELIRRLVATGVPVTAPSTRPLNRVLRAMDSGPIDLPSQPLIERLRDVARHAPGDEALPLSVGQHDRMISFPAGQLYSTDTSAAHEIVMALRPIVEQFVAETTAS